MQWELSGNNEYIKYRFIFIKHFVLNIEQNTVEVTHKSEDINNLNDILYWY